MVILEGQERAKPGYNEWLSILRDPKVECPIDDKWLKKLIEITQQDIQRKSKIDWMLSSTIVSGNYERRSIIHEKCILFGKRYNEPILRWACPVSQGKTATGRNNYAELKYDPQKIYPELIQYFVRGAECVFTGKINGLRKGTIAIYVDAVWSDKKYSANIDALPRRQITHVKQPTYIIVQIITKDEDGNVKRGQFIPVKSRYTQFKDKHAVTKKTIKRACKRHPTELTMSKTYHTTQGGTHDDIILSLNSCSKSSTKIKKLSIPSLYVGLSRVHDFDEHRIINSWND